ncbi:MAG TPA: hypothetical protein DDY52_04935 [Candidatus Moranbacteria bacterium]|nr:MAG: Phosphoribosylamine/glycine ligase [Candidatus Moranbacteria bacterium GW2011_GWF1_34_10]HBI17455.1 hypothetical protein [Candidatus Moranbacteria bacterium]
MRVLFVSLDLSGADLAYRFKKEGHQVRFFVEDKSQRINYKGILDKVKDWKKELDWVGKGDGLIVFDSIGYGKEQNKLRKQGYSVVGGCELGDKLEHDRQYCKKVFANYGVPVIPSNNFTNVDDAIAYIKKNKGPWVVKQNGHADKIFNYVGDFEDGRDVIDVLKNYYRYKNSECASIDIQKKAIGIEIGVARYFNGDDWVGPIELNIEHKDLYSGGLGPKTYEMGTLMWMTNDENNRLFKETLAKLKDYLRKIDFRGDVDVNCIVDEKNVYPLELTTRFGWPATHLHVELIKSPIGEFLKAVADGKQYDLKYKKEFATAVLVATPPFPYHIRINKYSSKGEYIYFNSEFTLGDMEHIHFEEVSKDKYGNLFISSNTGFILHVTHSCKTAKGAQKKCIDVIKKVIIPKKFYRNDIGLDFHKCDKKRLKEWGWI